LTIVADRVCDYTEASQFYTIEALCTEIAKICCVEFDIEEAIVRIDKPAALKRASSPAVEIKRSKAFFASEVEQHKLALAAKKGQKVEVSSGGNVCYIGIGSNLGDRALNIHTALQGIKKVRFLQ
jgi:hypothetical protein